VDVGGGADCEEDDEEERLEVEDCGHCCGFFLCSYATAFTHFSLVCFWYLILQREGYFSSSFPEALMICILLSHADG